ncbi:MAG: HAD-IIA family hydrolase [Negativicutes bacterium]|nr:HAD-IIA family hydrolase [Negativicutes bacterium]
MDGTFYLGNRLLPGSLEFIEYLRATGRDFLFLTNNSSKTAPYYAEKLGRMGLECKPDDVLTSGEATTCYLHAIKPGARVFLLGTPELEREFSQAGFVLTDTHPDFVVLGFDTTLTYAKLETASRFIRAKVPFIATHPDINCPTEDGFIPDCGAMIKLFKAATGISPKIIGKPNREIVDMIFRKKNYCASEIAIIGDRLYTDIAAGKNAGICSILVLSGETREDDLAASVIKPDYCFAGLGSLLEALKQEDS